MHQFSDSDTPDSDEGIRFKTDSTRNKGVNKTPFKASRDRRRLSKSRSGSLERRRNRRIDDRDRNFRVRSRDRSRDKTKCKRRSFSREKRSVSRNRKLRRSRERRSYSRERRIRQKSRDRSKDRNSKYDKSPLKIDKDQRSKRSVSTEVKIYVNKRKKESDNPKRNIRSEEKLLHTSRETKKSKSKDRDIKGSTSSSIKDKEIDTTKLIKEQEQICMELAEIVEKAPNSSIDDVVVFGPVLPPKLLSNSSLTSEKSYSVSPTRQCKHKKSKKHSKEIVKQSGLGVDKIVIVNHYEDDVPCKRMDTRTFSKVSTSPISSDDHNSASDVGWEDGNATHGPVLSSNVAATEDKFVIEIEDSDVETENNTHEPIMSERNVKKEHNSSRNDYYGPDNLSRVREDTKSYADNHSQSVGPISPEHLREKLIKDADENGTVNISISDDEIEEGEIVGPILPGSKESFSVSQIALEERAVQYKLDRLSSANSDKDVHIREDWMLSLPEAAGAAKLGLGPRQFRTRAGPDMGDRSGWTDTPKDRESKQRSSKSTKEADVVNFKAEARSLEIEERDKEQERMTRKHHKKHRKKEDKSLLEMHQDKLKVKNKNDDNGLMERRPFNRDTDLKVYQFDDAQKKAIYKKAQLLDDRFSKGESQYL